MPSNVHSNNRDMTARFRSGGTGQAISFRCWGCDQSKSTTGSKNLSYGRKYCAACVAKKESK